MEHLRLVKATLRKNWLIYGVTFSAFVVSFVSYYYNFAYDSIGYNSDFAYYALAGQDIFSGNILLKGWFGSTNLFYLLSAIYGAAGKIWGYNTFLLYIVSALIWAALLSVISYMVLRLSKNDSTTWKILKLLAVFGFLMNSCYFTGGGKILCGTHFDVLIIGLLFMWNISTNIENKQNTPMVTVPLSAFVFLSALSDNMCIFFVFLPMFFILFINLYTRSAEKYGERWRIFYYLLLLIGLIVGAKVFYYIAQKNFGAIQLTYHFNGVSIINRDEFFSRIMFFVECLFNAIGINFFNKSFSFENASFFVRLFLILGVLVPCIICIKKTFKWKIKNIFNQFLTASVVTVVLAMIFTNYIDPSAEGVEYPSRILIYAIIPMLLLFSQVEVKQLNYKTNGGKKLLVVASFVCVGLLCAMGFQNIDCKEKENYHINRFQEVVKTLKDRGLSRGFGTFWLANATALASDLTIEVKPVLDGNDLRVYNWLSYDISEWDNASFILVDDSGWNGITRDTVINRVGFPDEEIMVENISVMIYSKNVMQYISNSGYQGKTLDAWWDFEDNETVKEIKINGTSFLSDFQPDMEGYFTSSANGSLLYGPYKEMAGGTYNITFYYDAPNISDDVIGYVDICSNSGSVIHGEKELRSKERIVTIDNVALEQNYTDIELRCYVNYAGVTVRRIIIEKIE